MALSQINNNSVSSSAGIVQTKISGLTNITDPIAFNVALLGFKIAVQHGLTVYNLKDGIVDEFNDASGVGSSPGGTYNSPGTSGYYSNQTSGSLYATYTTTAIGGPGAPAGTAASQSGAPTSFGSFTAPSAITGGVTAYVFGAGGAGMGINGAPTLYNFGVGGGGGFASGTLAGFTGGSTLYVGVGGGGAYDGASGTGGRYNGGSTTPGAITGGGLSGIFSTTYGSISAPTAYVVAGSGGAGAASVYSGGLGQYGGANGGGGGGTQGLTGGDQTASTSTSYYTWSVNGNPAGMSGGGGSQVAGGSGGSSTYPANSGSLFTGGPSGNGTGGGAGFYGGGGGASSPGSVGSRGTGGGGGGSSYYSNPAVTSGTTTSAQPGPAGGAYNSGGGNSGSGANSPYWSPTIGRGGQGPGTPSPGNVAGGDGYVVLAWNTLTTSTATITSAAFTATSVATKARLVVFQDNISPDTATINTDLVASVSRDGGTTWSTVTLTDSGYVVGSSGQRILTGTADISGQPSGTSMKWKLVAQTKGQKIHGVSLQWV